MHILVPGLASLISLIFAAAVFDQYLSRRRPYQLAWAIGLLAWAAGTAAEAVIGAAGLHPLPYRLWYLCGAILTAAWLGLGSLYLHLGHRTAVGHAVAVLLLIASIGAAVAVLSAPLDLSLAYAQGHLVGRALPVSVRLLTPFFNIFGTVLLVGGAVWSAVRFWRRHVHGYRVVANILIAAGALLPALGGSLSRFGVPEFLWLSELFGVIIIFLGFLYSQAVFSPDRFPALRHFLPGHSRPLQP